MVKRASRSRSRVASALADPVTTKAVRTKERIVVAALEMFRDKGYEATTMRMVAERAGVSVGNAYYYFASKELLLQAFYGEIHDAHVAAALPLLAQSRDLKKRLMAVMQAKLEVSEPYHRFAGLMFRTAADPKSPLSPFHAASRHTREAGIELFAEVLKGSKLKIPKDLAAELPALLWTYSMGIVLYWMHDDSPHREKTRTLTEHTVDIVVRCLRLASNPLMRPLRGRVLAMLRDLDGFAP